MQQLWRLLLRHVLPVLHGVAAARACTPRCVHRPPRCLACVRLCLCVFLCACVCACVCALRVHVPVPVCVPVCVCVRARAHVRNVC